MGVLQQSKNNREIFPLSFLTEMKVLWNSYY